MTDIYYNNMNDENADVNKTTDERHSPLRQCLLKKKKKKNNNKTIGYVSWFSRWSHKRVTTKKKTVATRGEKKKVFPCLRNAGNRYFPPRLFINEDTTNEMMTPTK